MSEEKNVWCVNSVVMAESSDKYEFEVDIWMFENDGTFKTCTLEVSSERKFCHEFK